MPASYSFLKFLSNKCKLLDKYSPIISKIYSYFISFELFGFVKVISTS